MNGLWIKPEFSKDVVDTRPPRLQTEATLVRGKFVILTILGLGLAMTGFAVWYRYQQSDQSVALWGAEHARRMRNAPQVEAWKLSAGSSSSTAAIAPDGQKVAIDGWREVKSIPDLSYIRRALVTDAFFEWDRPGAADKRPHWTHVLQFRDGSETTTIWIDDALDRVSLEETQMSASMNPGLLKSVRSFIDRHTASTNSKPKAPPPR